MQSIPHQHNNTPSSSLAALHFSRFLLVGVILLVVAFLTLSICGIDLGQCRELNGSGGEQR
jgi:hypothetical protein